MHMLNCMQTSTERIGLTCFFQTGEECNQDFGLIIEIGVTNRSSSLSNTLVKRTTTPIMNSKGTNSQEIETEAKDKTSPIDVALKTNDTGDSLRNPSQDG